jgi:hypothetical protein
MTILTIQDIGLKPATLRAIEKKARSKGKTPPEYVRALIERDLLADKTFDEILKPVRADFRKSGMTEDQLDQLVDRARKATRKTGRRTRRARP